MDEPGPRGEVQGPSFQPHTSSLGQSRKWEDWELPCYITSFLTIVILGIGLNAKPDLTIETWAHEKVLERLKIENSLAAAAATTASKNNNNNDNNGGDGNGNGNGNDEESE